MGKPGRPPGEDESLRERNDSILASFESGERQVDIARRLGITRERVRQIIYRAIGPGAKKKLSRKRRAAARRRQLDGVLVRLETLKRCVVCGGAIWRSRSGKSARTCSEECALLYHSVSNIRQKCNPDSYLKWRKSVAASNLRNADGKRPVVLEWAERVLANEQTHPNRMYTTRGSIADRVLKHMPALREALEWTAEELVR